MSGITVLDQKAKFATQRRNDLAANIWPMRYGTAQLELNPKVDGLGEGNRDRLEVSGLFFEQYIASIGKFAQKEQAIPNAAFELGAAWELSKDGGTTWLNVFLLKPPEENAMWYECTFARFIADANLTVTYEQGLGTYSQSEGNTVEDTTSAQFTAVVSQQQRPNDLDLPGTPASAIYLEGYHSNPTTAPEVAKQQKLSATLNGTAGQFVLLPTVQPPAGVNAGTGDLLKGFFVVKGL